MVDIHAPCKVIDIDNFALRTAQQHTLQVIHCHIHNGLRRVDAQAVGYGIGIDAALVIARSILYINYFSRNITKSIAAL